MEAIIERTSRRVTVSMSTRRWNRIQKLEQAYDTLFRRVRPCLQTPEETLSLTARRRQEIAGIAH